MKAKNKLLLFWALCVGIFIKVAPAKAVCPVCTVAVAGGLEISRWLGVDDYITAIWIGGLALSVTAWGWNYLKKRDKLNSITGILVLLVIYLSIIIPLYKFNYIGLPQNKLWGYDKVILGIATGTIFFWLGAFLHTKLKKRNEGKVYFKFQKVVVPVALLLIASLVYYGYCKCLNIF